MEIVVVGFAVNEDTFSLKCCTLLVIECMRIRLHAYHAGINSKVPRKFGRVFEGGAWCFIMSCWGPLFGYSICGKLYFVLHVEGRINDDMQF
ncbi:hypothetical protein VNO77_05229 [Canavalia gladiata]|uniref:Uncharacterized protein n=1 Tax=Canavalia gladiata TaxID=3824 RepID=A0AAN9MXY7_CANGL